MARRPRLADSRGNYAPPTAGNDDLVGFYAGLDWVTPQTGSYTLRVTSFEGVGTGELVVTRN